VDLAVDGWSHHGPKVNTEHDSGRPSFQAVLALPTAEHGDCRKLELESEIDMSDPDPHAANLEGVDSAEPEKEERESA